jgi:hypothetical protein
VDNPYKPGTLTHALHEACAATEPIAPLAAQTVRPKRITIQRIRATGTGQSKPQAASARRAVLDWIAAQPEASATVADLEAHFAAPCRGHVQKLVEKGHLEVLS